MMYLLLSILFLPFAVLGTPVSSGLPAAAPSLLATPTSPEGNSSISGNVYSGIAVNGTEVTAQGEEYCPVMRGPHIEQIDLGFAPFTIQGYWDDQNLAICLDLTSIVHLSHCAGSLRDGEQLDCQIDKGRFFRGDLRLYIKNDHELWLHLDGRVSFIHWTKDIHILNLKESVASGMPSVTPVATVASAAGYSSVYSNLPYSVVASAIAMVSPSTDQLLTTPSQPPLVEAS